MNVLGRVLAEGNTQTGLLSSQIVGGRASGPIQQHDKAALVTKVAVQVAVETAGDIEAYFEVGNRKESRQADVARVVQTDAGSVGDNRVDVFEAVGDGHR